jgi:hypothetical protein
MVFYQSFHSRWERGSAAHAEVAASTPAVTVNPTPPAPIQSATSKPVALPEAAIDRRYAEAHLSEWAELPARDPFLMVSLTSRRSEGTKFESPVSRWKLKAIWRQTGGGVAVINQHVYAEGDVIAGYRIDAIDRDRVWLDGPNGKEVLEFAGRQPRDNSDQPGARKLMNPAKNYFISKL